MVDINEVITNIIGGGVDAVSGALDSFTKSDPGKILVGGLAGKIAGDIAGIDPARSAIGGAAGVADSITKDRKRRKELADKLKLKEGDRDFERSLQDDRLNAQKDLQDERLNAQKDLQGDRLGVQEKIAKQRVDAQLKTADARLSQQEKSAKDKRFQSAVTTVRKRLSEDEKYQRNDWDERDRALYEKALLAKELGYDVAKPKLDSGLWWTEVDMINRKVVSKQLEKLNFI